MKLRRSQGAVLASGLLVFAGCMLLWRALPFWRALDSAVWRALVPVGGGLLGALKGVFVLRRTVRRTVERLSTLPEPFWPWQVYPPAFYPLLAVMIAAGVGLRYAFGASAPGLVAGLYFGIGSALLAASVFYLRAAPGLAAAPASAEPSRCEPPAPSA
ncbi:MAG: hypothetical protein D6731_18350 [Planctomycetota bacterium]|nr:MAG: hypothetical protein D6731_18350 [Planctomycetota bacterium]